MKLQILKLTIIYTLFSFSTLSAPCDGQAKLEPTLSMELESDIEILEAVTKTIKSSFSVEEIKSCIDNTRKLEKIIKNRESTARVLKWYTVVLSEHKKQMGLIQERIDFFYNDCEYYGDNCRTLNYHKNALVEEYQKEKETKLEVVTYINQGINLKRKEEDIRKTFDTNCKDERYDKEQVIKICRKSYSYEYPICRDFL